MLLFSASELFCLGGWDPKSRKPSTSFAMLASSSSTVTLVCVFDLCVGFGVTGKLSVVEFSVECVLSSDRTLALDAFKESGVTEGDLDD